MQTTSILMPVALALAAALPMQAALAQYAPPPPPAARYAPDRAPVVYGYASVLRVTPVYDRYTTDEQRCDGPPQPVQKDTTGGTLLGAVVGGVIGSTMGRGSGRKAAVVGGAVVGGVVGNQIAKDSGPDYVAPGCRTVQVTHDGDGPPIGFDVEYDYKGDVFTARMPYDPGNRIRVRVSAVPADGPPRYRR